MINKGLGLLALSLYERVLHKTNGLTLLMLLNSVAEFVVLFLIYTTLCVCIYVILFVAYFAYLREGMIEYEDI